MASKKITELTEATTLANADEFAMHQISSNATKKVSWANLRSSSLILEKTLSLTAAQLLTLNGTTVSIVASPGAGKAIEVVSASVDYTYGVATYTASQIKLITDTAASHQAISAASLLSTASSTFCQLSTYTNSNSISLIADKALLVQSDADGSGGVPTGTAKIHLTYRIITV